jgi:hypothetical protein
VFRKWVREYGDDPSQSFPGKGQMKPEQLEIERLRREVAKLKAERDILKNDHGLGPPVRGRNRLCYADRRRGVADCLLAAFDPVKKRGKWAVADLRVVTLFQQRSRLGK